MSFAVLLFSCSTVKAPRGSVPKREAMATDAYGGWITLSLINNENAVEGEFIAVNSDSLHVMVRDKVQSFATTEISSARVVLFNTDIGRYATWTILGSLATLSNGGLLIFTFPMWLITGIVTGSAESNRINFYDYPTSDWSELNKFTRFPQGIPDEVKITDVKPRFSLNQ